MLDGDALTDLDREMAAESLGWSPAGGYVDDDDGVVGDHRSGGVDGGGCDAVDVLVVHASDSRGGAVASAAAPRPAGPSEGDEGPSFSLRSDDNDDPGSSARLRSDDDVPAGGAAPAAASHPLTSGGPMPSTPSQAMRPGTALGGAPPRPAGSSQLPPQPWPGASSSAASAAAAQQQQQRPGTAAVHYCRPGTASQRPGTSSISYQQRPGTSSSYQQRPDTSASYQQRPGTAMGNGGGTKLASSEYLNEHPVLLEYLAKHVLQEGLALAQQVGVQGTSSGNGVACLMIHISTYSHTPLHRGQQPHPTAVTAV